MLRKGLPDLPRIISQNPFGLVLFKIRPNPPRLRITAQNGLDLGPFKSSPTSASICGYDLRLLKSAPKPLRHRIPIAPESFSRDLMYLPFFELVRRLAGLSKVARSDPANVISKMRNGGKGCKFLINSEIGPCQVNGAPRTP